MVRKQTDYTRNESSQWELSLLGTNVPGNFRSWEQRFPLRTFAPKSENTGSETSWYQVDGFSKTRQNDGTADRTAITISIGRELFRTVIPANIALQKWMLQLRVCMLQVYWCYTWTVLICFLFCFSYSTIEHLFFRKLFHSLTDSKIVFCNNVGEAFPHSFSSIHLYSVHYFSPAYWIVPSSSCCSIGCLALYSWYGNCCSIVLLTGGHYLVKIVFCYFSGT